MYISNSEMITTSTYKCGVIIGNYLVKNRVPLLSRKDNIMEFARTEKLQKVLDNMPLYLKALMKVGVING